MYILISQDDLTQDEELAAALEVATDPEQPPTNDDESVANDALAYVYGNSGAFLLH